jgi:uncharacterized protein YifN (PemK superfamily)
VLVPELIDRRDNTLLETEYIDHNVPILPISCVYENEDMKNKIYEISLFPQIFNYVYFNNWSWIKNCISKLIYARMLLPFAQA